MKKWTKEQNEYAINKASEELSELCRELNNIDRKLNYYKELHRQQRQKISKKGNYIRKLNNQLISLLHEREI